MTIKHILDALAAAPGRNDKMDILRANDFSADLKEFFHLALDPLVTFGIKKIPKYETRNPDLSLSEGMERLYALSKRVVTGNAAIEHLADTLSRMHPEDAECIVRIIEKDPKCGVAESTVNKVWKGLVFEFPVMKASPYDERAFEHITFPAMSQAKLDGARCAIVVDMGKVTCLSSSGREITTFGAFDWLRDMVSNIVIDGELLYMNDDGTFADRKTGNGIVNRALKGTIPESQAKNLHFVAFDLIPLNEWARGRYEHTYRDRFRGFELFPKQTNVSVVESRMVNDENEAFAHFREMLARGQEGTIVKDAGSFWEGKRRKDHVKLKGIISCEMRVVGVEEGTGKFAGKIGALVCESADGLVRVNVGTGLTDHDRNQHPSVYLDKIVRVAYNERIKNKAEGSTWSLFLPRFEPGFIRLDKNEADTIDNIPMKA